MKFEHGKWQVVGVNTENWSFYHDKNMTSYDKIIHKQE